MPVILGRNGVEKIVELNLEKNELDQLSESAIAVKKTNNMLAEMGLF